MIINKKTFGLGLMLLLLGTSACRDAVNEQEPGRPEIKAVEMPTSWNTNSVEKVTVELRGAHGDGPSFLTGAAFKVFNADNAVVFEGTLLDDGGYDSNSGDVLAGDGVYRNRYVPGDITSLTGVYRFEFRLSDKNGVVEKKETGPVLFAFDAAPEVISISVPSLLPSGFKPLLITARVTDPDSLEEIEEVTLDVLRNGVSVLADVYVLQREGAVSDSLYSLLIDSSFAAGLQGSYTFSVNATDRFGVSGTPLTQKVQLENEGGRIIKVDMPDQVQRPAVAGDLTIVPIYAFVVDPQGNGDIDSVYFFAQKPDSTFSNNGNPFLMVDNGRPFNMDNPFVEAGDVRADDGIYTLMTLISSSAEAGTYVFTFYMRDKLNHLTPVYTDSIEVLP